MSENRVRLGLRLPVPLAERLRQVAETSGLTPSQAAVVTLAGALLGGEEHHDE